MDSNDNSRRNFWILRVSAVGTDQRSFYLAILHDAAAFTTEFMCSFPPIDLAARDTAKSHPLGLKTPECPGWLHKKPSLLGDFQLLYQVKANPIDAKQILCLLSDFFVK